MILQHGLTVQRVRDGMGQWFDRIVEMDSVAVKIAQRRVANRWNRQKMNCPGNYMMATALKASTSGGVSAQRPPTPANLPSLSSKGQQTITVGGWKGIDTSNRTDCQPNHYLPEILDENQPDIASERQSSQWSDDDINSTGQPMNSLQLNDRDRAVVHQITALASATREKDDKVTYQLLMRSNPDYSASELCRMFQSSVMMRGLIEQQITSILDETEKHYPEMRLPVALIRRELKR